MYSKYTLERGFNIIAALLTREDIGKYNLGMELPPMVTYWDMVVAPDADETPDEDNKMWLYALTWPHCWSEPHDQLYEWCSTFHGKLMVQGERLGQPSEGDPKG